MAWTEPITWTHSQVVTAAQMNEQVRDNMLILKVALEDDGRITDISATTFADLDGSDITGLVRTDADNVLSGRLSFTSVNGRLCVPVGANKYATV